MKQSTSYPKIVALGSPGIGSIYDEDVEITEKVDGSQFGFGRIDGELIIRSKNQVMQTGNVQKLFQPAFDYITDIADKIPNGMFFYGETLCSPRHSTLAYERVPKHNIVLFGVYTAQSMDGQNGTMGDYKAIAEWAGALDIDPIPLLYQGKADAAKVMSFFDKEHPTVSYLGGQNIEGVVVKNYKQWLFLNQILLPVMAGKFVSEAFKEVHQKDWKALNTGKGKIETIKAKYTSEARYVKAVMRMREDGSFTGTLKDIGKIIKRVKLDLIEEEKENIKNDLWRATGDDIVRASTTGIPMWYKTKLLEGEINEPSNNL